MRRQSELGWFKEQSTKGCAGTAPYVLLARTRRLLSARCVSLCLRGCWIRTVECQVHLDVSCGLFDPTFFTLRFRKKGWKVSICESNLRTGFRSWSGGVVSVSFRNFTGLNLLIEIELITPYKGQFFNSTKSALAICQEGKASSSQVSLLTRNATSLRLKGDYAWLSFGISKTLNTERINR